MPLRISPIKLKLRSFDLHQTLLANAIYTMSVYLAANFRSNNIFGFRKLCMENGISIDGVLHAADQTQVIVFVGHFDKAKKKGSLLCKNIAKKNL